MASKLPSISCVNREASYTAKMSYDSPTSHCSDLPGGVMEHPRRIRNGPLLLRITLRNAIEIDTEIIMSLIHWWGAPRHIGSLTRLTSRLDMAFAPDAPVFEASQKMTVSLRGVMLHKPPMDRDGKNDLIIVTTNQFGDNAPVTRLHFMKDNVPLGWQGAFFDNVVLAVRDLRPETRRLTLRFQVYDLDRVPTALFKAVGAFAVSSALAAFPYLAPFAGAAATAIGPLTDLIGNLDKHDEIIDQRVALEISDPEHGDMLLQPGYFVCFSQPVDDARMLHINHQLRVLDSVNEFTECSYAVLEIEPAFTIDHTRELDQRAARLIAELDGKDPGVSAIECLRSAVDAADKFHRIERAQQLMARDPGELTESDRILWEELRSDPDLAPYLRYLAS